MTAGAVMPAGIRDVEGTAMPVGAAAAMRGVPR